MQKQSPGTFDDLTLSDTQTLLHDLHVHKIELEMQNEELRVAAIALDTSRARFVELYEMAPVGYCTVNEAGMIVQANLTLATLLGMARNTLVGLKPFSHLVFQSDQNSWYQLISRARASDLLQTCELRLRQTSAGSGAGVGSVTSNATGTPVWVQLTATAARDDAGEQVLHLAVTDISQQRQAAAALTDSEARWKFAVEGAGDGLWDWNIQTGVAFYSPRYKAMLGYAEADIGDTSDEWTQRIHPDDAPAVFSALRPYMDGKPGTAAVEFRMRRKDGLWQWILGRGMVVERDAHGKPMRMIGTNTDLTDRKHSEAAVLESETRLRTVVESTREAIAVHQDGKVVFVNPAAVQMLGAASIDDLLGKPILEFVHPDFRQMVLARIKRHAEQGLALPMVEEKFIRLDHTVIDVEVQGSPIVFMDKPATQVAMRDITESKQAQAKLQLAASVFNHAREGISSPTPRASSSISTMRSPASPATRARKPSAKARAFSAQAGRTIISILTCGPP